ncbi:MAG: GNAT family N-acetyltransferase [Caldilineaceae bacterium]|nr:GNAT family N-acetyltransferase [Caldilineaceae bacterium]MBP8108636.1 GNAT family N-acetyltransferase [Caldilineaceae bacterium]MBP8123189.1 GNAT family N-acetyltransferase [Caldilineaceae bacterium]MBP9072411.1 GNAT family N-acetyltransferase [Caldilineaceae bacterium]
MATILHPAGELTRSKSYTGIRPFDMGRDLRPVAEVIADAFADDLDAGGKAALREMRTLSYMGGMFGFFNRKEMDFHKVFGGFVWVEEGRVIGNVTVQKADSYGNRWQIANVAVDRAFRGRGIARKLVKQALDYAREMGGRWMVLQVRGSNPVARGLYERLGFEEISGIARWEISSVPATITPPTPMPGLAPFSTAEWRSLYEIVTSQHSTQAQWWRPLRQSDFRPTPEQGLGEWFARVIGQRTILRRAVADNLRRFEAAMIVTGQQWQGMHEIQLWVRPRCQGQMEADMLQWALAELQTFPRFPIRVELSTQHTAAAEVLESYGFHNAHSLLTMRYKLTAV